MLSVFITNRFEAARPYFTYTRLGKESLNQAFSAKPNNTLDTVSCSFTATLPSSNKRLTVVFVPSQHVEITLTVNLNSEIDRRAANKTIFNIVLLASTGVHHQLIRFTAIRASNIGGLSVEMHGHKPK